MFSRLCKFERCISFHISRVNGRPCFDEELYLLMSVSEAMLYNNWETLYVQSQYAHPHSNNATPSIPFDLYVLIDLPMSSFRAQFEPTTEPREDYPTTLRDAMHFCAFLCHISTVNQTHPIFQDTPFRRTPGIYCSFCFMWCFRWSLCPPTSNSPSYSCCLDFQS